MEFKMEEENKKKKFNDVQKANAQIMEAKTKKKRSNIANFETANEVIEQK